MGDGKEEGTPTECCTVPPPHPTSAIVTLLSTPLLTRLLRLKGKRSDAPTNCDPTSSLGPLSMWEGYPAMKSSNAARGEVIDVGVTIRWINGDGYALTLVLRRSGQARVDAQWEVYDKLSRTELLDVIDAVLATALVLG